MPSPKISVPCTGGCGTIVQRTKTQLMRTNPYCPTCLKKLHHRNLFSFGRPRKKALLAPDLDE